jgi:hypothetical protein
VSINHFVVWQSLFATGSAATAMNCFEDENNSGASRKCGTDNAYGVQPAAKLSN